MPAAVATIKYIVSGRRSARRGISFESFQCSSFTKLTLQGMITCMLPIFCGKLVRDFATPCCRTIRCSDSQTFWCFELSSCHFIAIQVVLDEQYSKDLTKSASELLECLQSSAICSPIHSSSHPSSVYRTCQSCRVDWIHNQSQRHHHWLLLLFFPLNIRNNE